MTYIVTPRRGGKNGEASDAVTVSFGGGGATYTFGAESEPLTIAA